MDDQRKKSFQPVKSTPHSLNFSPNLFSRLGNYLASHQIKTILLCTVVICSLFFPALSLYFSPDGPASAVARRGRGFMVWELEGIQRQGMIWSEDEICWSKLASYTEIRRKKRTRIVRMEQVLISSSKSSFGGSLDKQTLHQTLLVQDELSRRLLQGEIYGLTCVRASTSPPSCAFSSPTNYWSSSSSLLADSDIHETLSLPSTTGSALPLTLTNTLVGVGRDRRGTVKGAHYMAITFYLEDTSEELVLSGGGENVEIVRDKAKAAWRRAVRDVVGGKGWEEDREPIGKVGEGRGQGRRIVLKHLPFLLIHSNPRLLEDFIFLIAYLIVGIYAGHTLKRSHRVHWKVGLVFTGIVELIASGVMSLSVCWLIGLSVALVPWKLIPFLVIVCGLDNMFVLTNAIHDTDISLPVPSRVAAGLSSVGIYTTVTLVIELVIASLLMKVIHVQVIRELIVFASIALVVDYCMEMTFFTTILSIDIQRLELADLLSGGSSRPIKKSTNIPSQKPEPILNSFWTRVKAIYFARAARTATFGALCLINGLLYSTYGPDHFLPAFCSETALAKNRPILGPSLSAEFSSSLSRGRRDIPAESIPDSAAFDFWKLINPANTSSVHIYIEPVTVIKFYEDELAAPESAQDSIVDTPFYVKVGFVVLPIAAVTSIVYAILLYLLKDANLLESERVENVKAAEDRTESKGREAEVELRKLKGTRSSDIEVLASGRNLMVGWAGLDDQILVWKRIGSGMEFPSPFTLDMSTHIPSSILHLSIDPLEKFCAAATITGRMLIWNLETRSIVEFTSNSLDYGMINHLLPAPLPYKDLNAPPESRPPLTSYGFLSVHQNGSIVYWDCITMISNIVLPSTPTSDPLLRSKSFFVCTKPESKSLIYARLFSDGLVQLFRSDHTKPLEEWINFFDFPIGSDINVVNSLAFGTFKNMAKDNEYLAVGMMNGSTSVFDVKEGELICELEKMTSPIRKLRIIEPVNTKCVECSAPILDGCMIVLVTKEFIRVSRLFTSLSDSCNCTTLAFGTLESGMVERTQSRNGIPRGTPKKRRVSASRDPIPTSPLISHPFDSPSRVNGGVDNLEIPKSPNLSVQSTWRVETEVNIMNDDRGGCVVVESSIIGIRRRKLTIVEKKGRSEGIFGRNWEIWTYSLLDLNRSEASISLESLLSNEMVTSVAISDSTDLLRRRTTTATRSAINGPITPPSIESTTSIKFEEAPLPFSRARPIILISPNLGVDLGGMAVGLGNTVVVVRPKQA